MSDAENIPVTIRILDKEYLIACPPREEAALQASARLLDERLRHIRQSGKVIGSERMFVMAALNMANDLVRLQSVDHEAGTRAGEHVRRLRERIEGAVAASRPAEL